MIFFTAKWRFQNDKVPLAEMCVQPVCYKINIKMKALIYSEIINIM